MSFRVPIGSRYLECDASKLTDDFYCSIDLTVSELRSKERKLTRQIEVIRKALSEIGCEELPNGCDLDGSFDQSNEVQVGCVLER